MSEMFEKVESRLPGQEPDQKPNPVVDANDERHTLEEVKRSAQAVAEAL
jgi:hypothetical protein